MVAALKFLIIVHDLHLQFHGNVHAEIEGLLVHIGLKVEFHSSLKSF